MINDLTKKVLDSDRRRTHDLRLPVHHVERVPRGVRAIFSSEDVEEHLVGLLLGLGHGLLDRHRRLAPVLLAVGLVPLLDATKGVLE